MTLSHPTEFSGSMTSGDPYLPGVGNGGYAVDRYLVELDYRVASAHITATATITATASQDLDRFSLDFTGLTVGYVRVNDEQVAKLVQSARKLTIVPRRRLTDGETFTVTVRYGGVPHPVTSPFGRVGWLPTLDGASVLAGPIGSGSWFPCNDSPANKALFRFEISCESEFHVHANGRLVSRLPRGDRTTWVYESTTPMATHRVSVQIGRFSEVSLTRHPVPLYAVAEPQAAGLTSEALCSQPEMVSAFETVFGPFPFEDYSVVVTGKRAVGSQQAQQLVTAPYAAHGFSVFTESRLGSDEQSGRMVAHELSHSWFGSSVTLQRWSDVWLHEGFATYAEWIWSETAGGPSADSLAHRHWARLESLPHDLRLTDPGAGRMLDDRIGKRGALTLHAIRLVIGESRFRALLHAWVSDHRFGTATSVDFIARVREAATGIDVTRLLERWLYELRVPAFPTGRV
jgi:aminopeptidase N